MHRLFIGVWIKKGIRNSHVVESTYFYKYLADFLRNTVDTRRFQPKLQGGKSNFAGWVFRVFLQHASRYQSENWQRWSSDPILLYHYSIKHWISFSLSNHNYHGYFNYIIKLHICSMFKNFIISTFQRFKVCISAL